MLFVEGSGIETDFADAGDSEMFPIMASQYLLRSYRWSPAIHPAGSSGWHLQGPVHSSAAPGCRSPFFAWSIARRRKISSQLAFKFASPTVQGNTSDGNIAVCCPIDGAIGSSLCRGFGSTFGVRSKSFSPVVTTTHPKIHPTCRWPKFNTIVSTGAAKTNRGRIQDHHGIPPRREIRRHVPRLRCPDRLVAAASRRRSRFCFTKSGKSPDFGKRPGIRAFEIENFCVRDM